MNNHNPVLHDRVQIKEHAKAVLRTYRGNSIGVLVLYSVLITIAGVISFGLGDLFLAPPLMVGLCVFFLGTWRGEMPLFETLFQGFNRYTQSLVGILWMYLWTVLWSLLFVIPGIIKGYAYSMTPYLLADFSGLDPRDALKVSMAMTKGRKMEIFILQLSFFGWLLLTPFTFGILYMVHVGPYMQLAMAGMYESLLADAIDGGIITNHDLVQWRSV